MTGFRRLPDRSRMLLVRLSAAILVAALVGCGETAGPDLDQPPVTDRAPTPTAPARRVSDDGGAMTIAELRERLGIGQAGRIQKVGGQIVAMDLRATPVVDLSPLEGLPLRQLFLEETRVADIAPLEGMPLEQLYLTNTQVSDLSPLSGMSLAELNLVGTPVTDIGPLKDVELGTLWIPQTKVSDLSPLAGKQFVSLDVQGTPVSDLSPLAGNQSLRRLHIAETEVTDLSPLAGLKLERLIFSPEKITAGIDAIRNMTSLRGLDTKLEENPEPTPGGELGAPFDVMTPEEFWKLYDAGKWSKAPATPLPRNE